MTFNHEKLNVYQQALSFNKKTCNWVVEWDNRHAICDHLDRAASSILENIAMASATVSANKIRYLDYAIGSSLECAACLDIAAIKGLLTGESASKEKTDLSGLLRMTIGLRRSWLAPQAREERENYGVSNDIIFHHERLDVYRLTLHLLNSVFSSEDVKQLPCTTFRRLDELCTSIALNIAEGNGRFSKLDQSKFIEISHCSAIKVAAKLDLCLARNMIQEDEVKEWKGMIERIASMTSARFNETYT